jgi:hypothetical protein
MSLGCPPPHVAIVNTVNCVTRYTQGILAPGAMVNLQLIMHSATPSHHAEWAEGILTPGAMVNLQLNTHANHTGFVQPQPLYILSLIGAIRDLWTAKVYVLPVPEALPPTLARPLTLICGHLLSSCLAAGSGRTCIWQHQSFTLTLSLTITPNHTLQP